MQSIGNVLYVWQQLFVRGCDQVQTAVIATRLPQSIIFWHHVQRRGPWWFWITNNASGFQPFEFRFGILKFFWIKAVGFCKNRGLAAGVDVMLNPIGCELYIPNLKMVAYFEAKSWHMHELNLEWAAIAVAQLLEK
jgi:hypothetical protein